MTRPVFSLLSAFPVSMSWQCCSGIAKLSSSFHWSGGIFPEHVDVAIQFVWHVCFRHGCAELFPTTSSCVCIIRCRFHEVPIGWWERHVNRSRWMIAIWSVASCLSCFCLCILAVVVFRVGMLGRKRDVIWLVLPRNRYLSRGKWTHVRELHRWVWFRSFFIIDRQKSLHIFRSGCYCCLSSSWCLLALPKKQPEAKNHRFIFFDKQNRCSWENCAHWR